MTAKQVSNELIFKINAEIETSCIDSDISSSKALYMIDFIRPLFEELREYIHKYNFRDNEEEIDFFKNSKPLILSKLIYYNDIIVPKQYIWINITFSEGMRTTSYAIIVAYWIEILCSRPVVIIG